MIIPAYGQHAAMYMPSVGEMVLIRLSPVDPYARVIITGYSRRRQRAVRYAFLWMETVPGTMAVEGAFGHLHARPDGPPLIKQINRGQSPTPESGTPDPS